MGGPVIRGTVFMKYYLRLLGATVGDNVFFDASPPLETSALTIEDDAVVEAGAMVLGHVVDHGVMQHGFIKIGRGSVVGSFVNVQPGANIGAGAVLGCLTLAMKFEVF